MGANVACIEGCQEGCRGEGATCINGVLLAEGQRPGFLLHEKSQEMVNHKLLIAARDGDLEGVASALAHGAWLGTRRPFVINQPGSGSPIEDEVQAPPETVGLTPLMHAANGGYAEVCELLLSRWSSEVESEDEDGLRALHFAARSGSLQTCAVLLRYGADPGAQDVDGRAPLDHVPPGEMSTPAERRTWQALLSEGAPACSRVGCRPRQDHQAVRSGGARERAPEAADDSSDRTSAEPAAAPERPPEPSFPAPVSLPGLARQ